MGKGLLTFGVALLASAGVAVAAGGPTVKVSVKPDKPNAQSTLSIAASGNFGHSGLPTSVKLTVQKGFRTSAKSVPVLCNTKKVSPSSSNPCPAKSKIGSGKVVATVQLFGKQTVPFTMYLGTRPHKGDVAAIILSGDVPVAGTQNVIGRLLKTKSGGLEILFSHLLSVPVSGTLNQLSLSAHAVNSKHSLITNPPACHGHWTGAFKLGFKSGSESKTVAIACSK